MKELTAKQNELLQKTVDIFTETLKDNIVSIYLHGSLALGCFNPKYSDLDLLIIVKRELSPELKKELIDSILIFSDSGFFPAKDLEFSIVSEEHLKPFIYPTPYELHYSRDWKEKLRHKSVEFYINKEYQTDKDLGAHFRVAYERGVKLFGKDISYIMNKPADSIYLDAVMYDISDSQEDNVADKEYHVLNLCRTFGFLKTGIIMSKEEGGIWLYGITDEKFQLVIKKALDCYSGKEYDLISDSEFRSFTDWIMDHIKQQYTDRGLQS